MAGKKRNRQPTLVLDESVQGTVLSAFERYASVQGILYGDVLEVSKTSPGMPDDLLIQKHLNVRTILLTTDRGALLLAAAAFLEKARGFEEVLQVALIGSLSTNKTNPKDLDLMVTVAPGCDLKRLAKPGRQTQGRVQRGHLGVDIFLVEIGKYLGRACSYREPHSRMLCTQRRLSCDLDRCFLCHTSGSFVLKKTVVEDPPIVLHPAYSARVEVPDDVRRLLAHGAVPASSAGDVPPDPL